MAARARSSGASMRPMAFDVPIRWLEQHAQVCDGLFRQSGKSDEIDRLCALIEEGVQPHLTADADPYTIAGLLQRFLLELPEPLLTWHLYDDFIGAVDSPAALLRAMARLVPPRNRYMLVRLMRLLGAVADNSEHTRMPANNLATVFAPSLLRHRDPTTAFKTMRVSIDVVRRLIVERADIFGSRCAQHPPQVVCCVFAVCVLNFLIALYRNFRPTFRRSKLTPFRAF